MNLLNITESFLIEDAALTKGSQRVMNDKNLVANLADAIRDDSQSNPSSFPAGFARSSQKAPDAQLAQWFLENIDKIEKEGYDGIVYSRDGVNSDWIVRRYIAGSHNWEDITGVMNMNLLDWYLLKNRGMLDTNHKDLPKFNSVRDVGYYMTTHYKDKLGDIKDAAKKASLNKKSKSLKLVDNDDYRIYTTLNRRAGCALGLGTQWCTANSSYDGHYHTYSNKAMLFQLFPYKKVKDEEGNLSNVTDDDGKKQLDDNEKYQFDAGGPNFMDITDRPASPAVVQKKFPYLYTDLAGALKQKKPEMEKIFKELSEDPTLQEKDFKIKTYEIDDEIQKLGKFEQRGYFTDEVRKKAKTEKDDANAEQPQLSAPVPPAEQPGENPMESIKHLAKSMLEDDDELDEEGEELDAGAEATGGDLGSMGGSAGPSGGGKYPPGTAPTMPESFNHKGTEIMENIDKDVAAMLGSLKKYDMLVESCAPVLMARPKPYISEAEEEDDTNADIEESGKPEWLTKAEEKAEDKEDLDEETVEDFEKRGGKVDNLKYKGDKKEKAEAGKSMGSKHLGTVGGKGTKGQVTGSKANVNTKTKEVPPVVKTNESFEADQEVLDWMNRFAKLGNMKGYGR